ncbi:MAG: rhodanese-like domain-containing protein [Syntrophales bacterium]|nr:rhodanese-like domain-containing protein [Syntrophales bacterium]
MKIWHALVFYGIFFTVAAVLVVGFALKQTTSGVSPLWLTPQEAKEMIDKTTDVVIVDLSPRHYDKGHLPGAVNYPTRTLPEVISTWDKDATYLVYSHWTGAPLAGAELLKDAGFKNVYALKGNYGAWLDLSYPVE